MRTLMLIVLLTLPGCFRSVQVRAHYSQPFVAANIEVQLQR